ncbi:MAG TPA: transcriptional repressor LexA [Bryobacteraceae bacterium]|nr:transcriptional repressor LexA [Bryobacteraceae bacterium]
MALTKRQKEVIDFIAEYIHTHGYSPSYEEIGKALDLASLATVHKHISALEQKQYLRRSYNQSRSLELAPRYFQELSRSMNMNESTLSIPLLGQIAAGVPVETPAMPDCLILSDFLRNENLYALRVRGESMIDDHICDGDYVLVERAANVKDGDIVVALIEGMETTLKRFFSDGGGRARLQPANSDMRPINVSLEDLEIQGRVLAVLRRYTIVN